MCALMKIHFTQVSLSKDFVVRSVLGCITCEGCPPGSEAREEKAVNCTLCPKG